MIKWEEICFFAFCYIACVYGQTLLAGNACKTENFLERLRAVEFKYEQCMHNVQVLADRVLSTEDEMETFKTNQSKYCNH